MCIRDRLGTAATDDHLSRLFRQVSDLVFCFDGDRAGQSAAGKALMLVLPHLEDGRKATFMFLPEGDDPDSVIRREGKEGFLKRVDSGLDVSAWLFQKLSSDLADAGHDLNSISGKAALAKEAVRWISTMPEGAFRQLMVDEVGQRTGVTQQRLDQMAESAQSTRYPRQSWSKVQLDLLGKQSTRGWARTTSRQGRFRSIPTSRSL